MQLTSLLLAAHQHNCKSCFFIFSELRAKEENLCLKRRRILFLWVLNRLDFQRLQASRSACCHLGLLSEGETNLALAVGSFWLLNCPLVFKLSVGPKRISNAGVTYWNHAPKPDTMSK